MEYSYYIIGAGTTLLLSLAGNIYMYYKSNAKYKILEEKEVSHKQINKCKMKTSSCQTIGIDKPPLKGIRPVSIELPKIKNNENEIIRKISFTKNKTKEVHGSSVNTNDKTTIYFPPYSIKSDIPEWARQEYLEKII